MHQSLISFNKKQREPISAPDLQAGDVVKIHRKIKEGGKERTQVFQGTIIAIKGGQSSSKTITVRKVSSGVGVELILPLASQQIEKIEFVKRTRARRAKLYFVRTKSVKTLSKKLKEVAVKAGLVAAPVEEAVEEAPVTAEEPAVEEVIEKTEA
jgi:large subunit ribosomal protein L19